MRKHGFTLVELLVVLGIIALLAGILWVVFAPAREKARQSVCISNLHQIGVALSLYRSDYDGQEAMQGVPMTPAQLGMPVGTGFGTLIHSYIKDRRLLYCPDYWLDPNIPTIEKQHALSSYYWDYEMDGPPAGEPEWFRFIVARHGNKAIVVFCEEHNDMKSNADLYREASWKTKRELVLRLNNQVQSLLVPVRSMLKDWP